MKTIKIIDLLNMIANGEDVPTIIKYKHKIWTYRNDVKDYTDETQFFFGEYIFQDDTQKELNDEVEIIEEDKKIEKIIPTSLKGIDNLDEKIEVAHIDTISAIDKINEIIDYISKENK